MDQITNYEKEDLHDESLSTCIVCKEYVIGTAIICQKKSCQDFYQSILQPLQSIQSILASKPTNWNEYFRTFIELPFTAQIWTLVYGELTSDIFWESISLIHSTDIWTILTSNEEFRRKFYLELEPKLLEELKHEIEIWKSFEEGSKDFLEDYSEKIRNFIFLMMEHVATLETNRKNP